LRIEKGRLRLPGYTEHLAAFEGWVVVGIEIVDTHQLLAPAGAGSWAAQLLAASGGARSAGPWKSSRAWSGGGGTCEGAAAAVELAEGRHGFAECFSKPKDLPVDDAVAEIVNGQTSRDADAALRGPRSCMPYQNERMRLPQNRLLTFSTLTRTSPISGRSW
jgi:hypothetical protein